MITTWRGVNIREMPLEDLQQAFLELSSQYMMVMSLEQERRLHAFDDFVKGIAYGKSKIASLQQNREALISRRQRHRQNWFTRLFS